MIAAVKRTITRLGVDPHVLQTELDDEVKAHLGAMANAEQTIGAPPSR